MKDFAVIVHGKRKYSVSATSAEMAYRAECCWYSAETPVTIHDLTTDECWIFTRQLDNAGNLLRIIAH